MTLNLCLIFALPVGGIDSRGPDVAIKCGGANFSFICITFLQSIRFKFQIGYFSLIQDLSLAVECTG